jgi:uncharacterized protein involved in exopolysaccharide biosynthesis
MNEEDNDIITINFKAFFQVLWKEKILLSFITLLFTAAGAFYAFTAQEEFVSEGKILPEISGGGASSSLGGLANLVGIGGFELGLKNNTDAIRPDLYPDVIKSTQYFMELMGQKVITKTNKEQTFEEFYHTILEEGEKPEQKEIQKFPVKENGFLVLNRLNEDRIKDLKERIQAAIDKKSGMITISVKMPDPVVAAQVARFSMNYLTEYVSNYRTEKSKKEVDFLGQKVAAARGKYYTNQVQKAQYGDQFQLGTMRLQSADIQRERLESEYKMSSSVYNELLKKYEEAKIKLNQETPVFKVLEPPAAPTQKSEPKKSIILFASLLLGFILAIMVALIRRGNYKMVLGS